MAELKHRIAYTIGAIRYHTRHNNAEQVKFYQSELVRLNKGLTK